MTELHFRNTEECINRIKSIKEMYAKDTPSEVALKDAINALEKQIEMKKYCDENDCADCPYHNTSLKDNRCMNDFIIVKE